MTALFVFTLAVFAVTFIVGQAKISYPLRSLIDSPAPGALGTCRRGLVMLLECNACSATWLGVGAFLFHLTPAELTSWWISGLYCCASSLILATLLGFVEP